MPPLPTLWDPAGAVDKLPQPFRMIDKILADIVEQVVDLIGKREQQRKLEEAAKVSLTFAPHAVMEVPWDACGFQPIGIAGIAVVALPDGELRSLSARDASTSCSDRTHSSTVTTMAAGLVVSTSGRLLAAASATTLSIHEVDIKTCELMLLAAVPLPPADPDSSSCPPSPVRLHWSDTLGHLAVCYGSGALVLYGVSLPVPNVALDGLEALMALHLRAFGATRLTEILRVPAAAAKAFCQGSASLGPSHVMWQQQQRPDKMPHADRYRKSARGAYIWWEGSSRLLLVDIAAAAAAATAAASGAAAAGSPGAPDAAEASSLTAASGGKPPVSKTASTKAGAAGAGGGAATVAAPDYSAVAPGPVTAAATPPGEPAGPPRSPALAPLTRDWLLPYNITAAAATADRKTLAWGLADGSVVLWDDRSGCAVKVLPRLRGAISALGWVNGVAHKLMVASASGCIFIADILKPEDSSAKPYELPQPVHAIHFLPSEPFALCVCRGQTAPGGEPTAAVGGASGRGSPVVGGGAVMGDAKGVRPRIIWYNVLEEKPVAELMGPQEGQGFGLACCLPAPPPLPPPPPPEAAAADAAALAAAGSAAGSKSATPEPGGAGAASGGGGSGGSPAARQAMLTALAAMGANVQLGPQLVPVPMPVPAGKVVSYPALSVSETYLVAGGDVCDKLVHSHFAEEEGAVPQRVLLLYMYKVDALLRHLLPEDETSSRLGRVVLDRLLADLEAPRVNKRKGKRVTLDVEDLDTPKLPSSMRKPDPLDAAASLRPTGRAANRHITFGAAPDELFDDAPKAPKAARVFPKETKKGLKTGPDDTALAGKDRRGPDGKPRLAPLGLEKAKEAPPPFAERSQSPPWHHTNPLARIHPDWEEAPVLVRIMERIGSKGGGRKRRDKRLDALTGEMMAKFAREAGAKPNLLVT